METGGFRCRETAERLPRDCRETAETDLTIGGAKETRQKREDFGFIIVMLMEEEVMIQKQSRQLLGDGKLSDIIG